MKIMEIMRRKRTRLIMFSLLFVVMFFASPILAPQIQNGLTQTNDAMVPFVDAADGDAWLTGWRYRQPLEFQEVGSAGTYYQIRFDVNYGSGAAAVNTIWTDSHCLIDFGDIRFTDGDGVFELDYWMEEKTDSDDATFWVEVKDSLSLGQTTRIYIYYGKTGESTTSNGANTFPLMYEDWSSQSVRTAVWDVWLSDGTISYSVGGDQGGYVAKIEGNAGVTYALTSDYDTAAPMAIIFRSNIEEAGTGNTQRQGSGYAGAFGFALIQTAATDIFYVYDDDGNQDSQAMVNTYFDTYTTWQITRDGTNVRLYADYALIEIASFDPDEVTTNPAVSISCADSEDDIYSDWVAVRKFIGADEPYVAGGNVGPEETAEIINVGAEVTNPDDTNNLYAKMREYILTTNTIMQSGYTDIDAVRVFIQTSAPVTVATVKYDQDGDTFSLVSGTITLVTGSCVDVGSGIYLDLTFVFTVPWVHSDYTELELRMVSTDDWEVSDEDYYGDYDIETRLDVASPTLNDGSGTVDRGDYDTVGGITASATIHYMYFPFSHPPINEIDVHINCSDTGTTSWNATNYEASGGTFSVAVDSDDIVGQDTYYFKPVVQDDGASGTNLGHALHSDTYIADRVQVTWIAVDDTVVNPSDTVTFTVGLIYDYDNANITAGTFSLQYGSTYLTLTHSTSGNWTTTDTSATAAGRTYDAVNGTGTLHGVTELDVNSKSVFVTWDKINLTISTNYDWSIIGYNTTLSVSGLFDYSGWIWNGTATWNCSTVYPFESTVGRYYYTVSSISEPDFGVTSFQVTPLYVVFDNITGTFILSPSEEISNTFVYTIFVSGLSYAYNGSMVSTDWLFEHIKNDTSYISGYGTDGSGYWNPVTVLIPVNSSWSAWKYECNASLTSRGFDFTFYTVTSSTEKANDWCYVSPYTSTGEGIELERFLLYVDGSRIYDRSWKFYGSTSSSYEICVQDYFGNEIYNSTHAWARNIDVLLQFYTLKIYSQLQEDPIHFSLSYGGTTRSEWIGIGEILRYSLAAATYTFVFRKNQVLFVGSIDLSSADNYYTITELDLWDIMNKPAGGGGDDDAMELYILNVLTFGIIGIFGLMFLLQIPAIMNFFSGRQTRQPSSTGDRRRY